MKFYTSTGDDGYTGLLGDERVPKYHKRPTAYGEVDETQAALGMARAFIDDEEVNAVLLRVQYDLYRLMSELAATPKTAPQFRTIDAARVEWLEELIDSYGARLSLPGEFTVSGATPAGANLDLARTVCRRAERAVVTCFYDGLVENDQLMRYLNRLSSLLYVLSRYADALSGHNEVTITKDIDA